MSSDRWQQIEELYHAALKLDGNQRAAFLESACDGNQDLRREVESLLACRPAGRELPGIPGAWR